MKTWFTLWIALTGCCAATPTTPSSSCPSASARRRPWWSWFAPATKETCRPLPGSSNTPRGRSSVAAAPRRSWRRFAIGPERRVFWEDACMWRTARAIRSGWRVIWPTPCGWRRASPIRRRRGKFSASAPRRRLHGRRQSPPEASAKRRRRVEPSLPSAGQQRRVARPRGAIAGRTAIPNLSALRGDAESDAPGRRADLLFHRAYRLPRARGAAAEHVDGAERLQRPAPLEPPARPPLRRPQSRKAGDRRRGRLCRGRHALDPRCGRRARARQVSRSRGGRRRRRHGLEMACPGERHALGGPRPAGRPSRSPSTEKQNGSLALGRGGLRSTAASSRTSAPREGWRPLRIRK